MICENLREIWERIDNAAKKSGRSKSDITLVAVSKTFPVEKIIEAYECGQKVFGENRVQEALKKIEYIKEKGFDLDFHLIGHLQTNKVRYLKDNFSLIQSVDRVELAELINKRAARINRKQDVLIQVNIAREERKSGVLLENLNELVEFVSLSKNLVFSGFMMIPPLVSEPEENRKYFAEMRELFEKYKKGYKLKYLSMGMSGDFEIAIEEGSNMVRIGSAIFGERIYK